MATALTALVGLGCGRTVPVQAPMVAVDAAPTSGAGRPSSSAPPARDGDELPLHRGARFAGTYVCAQGKTALTFVFDDVRSGVDEGIYLDVTFTFQFDGGSSGTTPADGSAHMKGTFDPKTRRLRLHAESWIEQPADYSLIDFSGAIDGAGVYSGRVEGHGCTTFTAAPDRSDDTP